MPPNQQATILNASNVATAININLYRHMFKGYHIRMKDFIQRV